MEISATTVGLIYFKFYLDVECFLQFLTRLLIYVKLYATFSFARN